MERTCGNSSGDGAAGAEMDRRKGRLHGEAAKVLRKRILTGELPPGARLREVQLCEELGISRTPIREALRTLAAEGLVALLPNRSVVVTELQNPEIEHLIVVFAEVEALAARLACERVTEEEIKEIGGYLSEMVDRHAQQERSSYLALNQKIHRRTVEVADNPVLLSVWMSLAPRVERARALPNLDRERWTNALFEHSKMFTALASRNGEALAQLTREHFLIGLPFMTARTQGSPTRG